VWLDIHKPTVFSLPTLKHKLKSKSHYDRQSVGQSVLVSGAHLGPATIYFLLEIFFRQLRFCNFVAPSLTRGRVCKILVQLLLVLARAVTLGSKSRRTHGHILLSHLRLPSPACRARFPYLYPPGTGWPKYTYRELGSLFVAS
jgi:hypothetical protein